MSLQMKTEHNEIATSVDFLRGILEAISGDDKKDIVSKLHAFYDTYLIKHFEWEDQEIFPLVLEKCTDEEKQFIQKIQNEHQVILATIHTFEKQTLEMDSNDLHGAIVEISQTNTKLFDMIIDHAKLEDEKLMPLLIKYGIE